MSIRDEVVDILEALDGSDYMDVADAILARFAVVGLPEGVQDDDGQTWFDDYDIRVDHTGRFGPEVYFNKKPVTPDWLRGRAAEYLAAVRDAEAQP